MTRHTPTELREMAETAYELEWSDVAVSMLRQAADDAERLDFLGSKCAGASDSERYLPFRIYWGRGQKKAIREAIDAARKETT
jgi:hypothetical protein